MTCFQLQVNNILQKGIVINTVNAYDFTYLPVRRHSTSHYVSFFVIYCTHTFDYKIKIYINSMI